MPEQIRPAVLVVNGQKFGLGLVEALHSEGLRVRVAKDLGRIGKQLAEREFDLIILPEEHVRLLPEILTLTVKAGIHILIIYRDEYKKLNRRSRRVTQLHMEIPEHTAASIARDLHHQRTNGTPSSPI